MTKQELLAKYKINRGHQVWQPELDNWFSVEIYRRMHEEQLPPPDDTSVAWVCDFIDKTKDPTYFFALPNPGSHYMTALRMVYRHADAIVQELNDRAKGAING